MKHRIPAILTAAILLLTPIRARAVGVLSYSEAPNGTVRVLLSEGLYEGFMLVTDETVTLEQIAAVKGVADVVPLNEMDDMDHEWTTDIIDVFSAYGNDTVIWQVQLKPAYMEIYREYCQDFTILIDGAYDAVWLHYTDYGFARWNGSLQVSYRSGERPDADRLFRQMEVEDRAEEFWVDWRMMLEDWEHTVSARQMTNAEYWAARQEAGIETDYEIICIAEQFADEIREIYGNAYGAQCRVDFTLKETHRAYDGGSVWADIGDCNMDHAVDAQDAAMVLQLAAAMGAGETPRLTDEQRDRADVNRDDVMNATDASSILRYAAARGSGEMQSFAEMVR